MLKMLGEEVGGSISRVDIARLRTDDTPTGFTARVVTATRDAEDRLSLVVWDVPIKGSPVPRGASAQGSVREIAITSGNKDQVLTAMRDSQGELRLITWTISTNGETITRAFTEEPKTTIQSVDVGMVDGDRFNTACRDTEGRLVVAEWELGRDGSMRHLQSLTPGPDFENATEISITDSFTTGSIVAMRNSGGSLRTLNWASPLRRGGMGEGGEISRIAVGHESGHPEWITAVALPGPTGVRTGPFEGGRLLVDAGLLKIIAWRWGSEKDERDEPERLAAKELSGTDGLAAEVAAIGGLGALKDVYVTAHRGFGSFKKLLAKDRGKPRVTFNAWKVAGTSKEFAKIEHLGEVNHEGTFNRIAMARGGRIAGERGERFVAAARDGDGRLRVKVGFAESPSE